MIALEVAEYGVLSDVALDIEQRDALAACPADLTLAPVRGTTGRYSIRAGPQVGVVVVPGLTLRIRPKVDIAHLFLMLSAAGGEIDWNASPTKFSESDAVEDVAAMAMADAVLGRMHLGLLRGYVEREDESTVVRGRLQLAETLRRHPATFLPLSLDCCQLEEDVPENRIIRTAIDRLLRRVRTHAVRSRLLRAQQFLRDVSPLRAGEPLPTVEPTRLNVGWWDAVELAVLVLHAFGLDLPAGAVAGRSFVVNMNTVFERFVHRALADELRRSGLDLKRVARGLDLDEEGLHPLAPDLTLWRHGRCLFAGDCKYKIIDDGVARRDDVYQALAYATAAHLSDVMLIYGEGPTIRDVRLVDGDTTIRVRRLDMSASAECLRALLRGVALEILSLASHFQSRGTR